MNNQLQLGVTIDTGKKWIDANGAAHVIYRKAVDTGALPNATSKNVAHGQTIALSCPVIRKRISAWNGTTNRFLDGATVTITVTATNIVVDSGAVNLSAYTSSFVEIEFCKA